MNRRNIVSYRISFSFKVLIFSNFPTGRKIRSSRKINRQNVAKGRESRLRKRLENTDLAYNFVYGSSEAVTREGKFVELVTVAACLER